MATDIYATPQSTGELRTHYVDFTNDLPTNGTVDSAIGSLISYPTGGSASVTVGTVILANIVPVTVGTPTVAGNYTIDVTATLSDADQLVARLIIPVVWYGVRSDMTDIIVRLREITDAQMDDYSIAGANYWSDKHLQDALDRHSAHYDYEEMNQFSEMSNGTYVYKQYLTGVHDWQGSPTIREAGGTAITGYTFEPMNGIITWTADQYGSSRYISGTAFDLNGAAADVWRMKIGHYASHYDFSTDGHSLKRSQLMQQAQQMASYFEGMAGPNDISIYRSDCTGALDYE